MELSVTAMTADFAFMKRSEKFLASFSGMRRPAQKISSSFEHLYLRRISYLDRKFLPTSTRFISVDFISGGGIRSTVTTHKRRQRATITPKSLMKCIKSSHGLQNNSSQRSKSSGSILISANEPNQGLQRTRNLAAEPQRSAELRSAERPAS
jgi:hypothetical protein